MTSTGAWIVIAPDTPAERVVPVHGRLLVGRECHGAAPGGCLILDDGAISRDHMEIRAAPERVAELIDLSTNGTRVNGRRVERGQPIVLCDGDRIELGSFELQFRAPELARPIVDVLESTIRATGPTHLAIAVGDIVGYTGLTARHGGVAVAAATDDLFAALGGLISAHGGTISNFAGDAIFAAWDADRNPDAAARAVEFALAADTFVTERAPSLEIRDASGTPVRMGWAVTLGDAGVGRPTAAREAIHGDAVILAFRLAGVAARDGNAPVLVSGEAAAAAPGAASYGRPEEIRAKGYTAPAEVRAATYRQPS